MTNSKIPTALALSIIGSGALAEELPANLNNMFSVTGECQMLVFADERRPCRQVMVNSEYDNGRIGFYFLYEIEGGGTVSWPLLQDFPNSNRAADALITRKALPEPFVGLDAHRAGQDGSCCIGIGICCCAAGCAAATDSLKGTFGENAQTAYGRRVTSPPQIDIIKDYVENQP